MYICQKCRAKTIHIGLCDECRLNVGAMNVDPDKWRQWAERCGATPVDLTPGEVTDRPATISYNMSPQRFQLEIPVEALGCLSPVDEQRIHDMLNFWVQQHRPRPALVSIDRPQQQKGNV